jgi:hypothetical protein
VDSTSSSYLCSALLSPCCVRACARSPAQAEALTAATLGPVLTRMLALAADFTRGHQRAPLPAAAQTALELAKELCHDPEVEAALRSTDGAHIAHQLTWLATPSLPRNLPAAAAAAAAARSAAERNRIMASALSQVTVPDSQSCASALLRRRHLLLLGGHVCRRLADHRAVAVRAHAARGRGGAGGTRRAGLPGRAAARSRPRAQASGGRRGGGAWVSRAFPSWKRSILTEIYPCHACSDHVSEDANARAGSGLPARGAPAQPRRRAGRGRCCTPTGARCCRRCWRRWRRPLSGLGAPAGVGAATRSSTARCARCCASCSPRRRRQRRRRGRRGQVASGGALPRRVCLRCCAPCPSTTRCRNSRGGTNPALLNSMPDW